MILRLALILTLLCAGLIGLTRLAPPNEPASVLARNPCALPCLYGITPGQTTRDEVEHLVVGYANSFFTTDYASFEVMDSSGNAASLQMQFDDKDVVTSIGWLQYETPEDMGQLNDLFLGGLLPHRLFLHCPHTHFENYLTFGEDDQVWVGLRLRDKLTPATSILSIIEYAANPYPDSQTSLDCDVNMDWPGFAPLWKYQAKP